MGSCTFPLKAQQCGVGRLLCSFFFLTPDTFECSKGTRTCTRCFCFDLCPFMPPPNSIQLCIGGKWEKSSALVLRADWVLWRGTNPLQSSKGPPKFPRLISHWAVMGHGLEQVLGERDKEEAEVEKTLSSQFFHSSMVGHLGYFQILTIMVVVNDQSRTGY